MQTKVLFFAGVVLLASSSCNRDPLDWQCPSVQSGELVVTEICGPESCDSQWLEIYNGSAESLDLYGTELTLIQLNGERTDVLVRKYLAVDVGGYVVIGRFEEQTTPEYVDYGYLPDGCGESASCPSGIEYGAAFYDNGVIEISARGVVVDHILFSNLPSDGTWSLDGAIDPPSAEANDDEDSWCEAEPTPGEENPICS